MAMTLTVLFQFLGIISFVFCCLLPYEWIYFPKNPDSTLSAERREMLLFLFCTLLGVCMGSLSLFILRFQMIDNPFLNFMNMFITPFVVGRGIAWLHQCRTHVTEKIYLFDNVWNAYIFAFCITAMRYILI